MNIPRDGPLIKHGLLVISHIGKQSSLDPPPRAAFDAGLQSFAVSAVCFAAFSGSGRRSFQAGIKDLGTGLSVCAGGKATRGRPVESAKGLAGERYNKTDAETDGVHDDLVENGKGKIDDETDGVHDDLVENGKGKIDYETDGVHDDLAGTVKVRLMMKLTVCIMILLRTVKIR